jgi:hypothetical protein
MNDTTTDVIRSDARPLTSATGPFLAVRLDTTTRDFTASLGRRGPRATASELPFDNFVEEVLFNLCVEDRILYFDLAHFSAL